MPDAQQFEHFQVLNHPDGRPWELGRGAMGVTYKAFDTNLRCDVALKVISPQFLSSETARQRFVREARAAAQLRHPNVATVFHLGSSGDEFFYVMEYVDGETVESRLRREGTFPPDVALQITRQVARALIAAERQKLVHRDIKPANLMLVNEVGEEHLLVKVIDFGLAKSLEPSSDNSVTATLGGFVGTPHFASPEQLEEREIDVRSDIYSLGATLWYMLVGRPPFEGSMASVIHQHLGSELSPDVLQSLSPRVADLLRRMLAKDPEDRFQTSIELKQALDEILVDSETTGDFSGAGLGTDAVATMMSGTALSYATGQIISSRYEILERLPPSLFKAKDLQANRMVALRPIGGAATYDPQHLELLRNEVAKLCNIHHPNLTTIFGLETTDRGPLLLGEWTRGFTLLELLRSRGELRWSETFRLVQPLAKLLDFLADRELLNRSIGVGDVRIEPTHPNEDLDALRKAPVESWPPFVVKVDAFATANIEGSKLSEPTETMVGRSLVSELAKDPVQPLAHLIYELLGGVSHYRESASGARFAPVTALSEAGNAVLRPGVLEPNRFPSAVDFLTKLEQAAESGAPLPLPPVAAHDLNRTRGAGSTSVGLGPERGGGGSETRATVAPTEIRPEPSESEEEPRPVTSPWLLRVMTIGIVLFGLAALGAVVGISFFLNRQAPVPTHLASEGQAVHEGFVTLDTKPSGVSVQWNGQKIGTTPLSGYRLPVGKQTLQLQLSGYVNKSVDLVVTDGVINDLGLISLAQETGQFVVKTEPAGVPFEITSVNQKMTSGITPLTVENMPTGKYQVTLKRPGWPEITQEIDLTQGASVNVQHTYQGVTVSLKSDPAGATIYFSGSPLGQTPLTVTLPLAQVELTSKIGSLTPVIQRFVPDAGGNTTVEFKHTYGLLSVTSDRPDADVVVGGIDMGKPPLEGILPPSKQSVVVKVAGRPDQVRTADIQAGRRAVMQFTFGGTASPGASAAATPVNDSQPAVLRASPVETPASPNGSPGKSSETGSQGQAPTTIEATPAPTETAPLAETPTPSPTRPKPTPSPSRSREESARTKEEAYRKFDAQWDAKKNAMQQEKKYMDYQVDHSSGGAKEEWKYKRKVLEDRLGRLNSDRDAAKQQLKRQWNE